MNICLHWTNLQCKSVFLHIYSGVNNWCEIFGILFYTFYITLYIYLHMSLYVYHISTRVSMYMYRCTSQHTFTVFRRKTQHKTRGDSSEFTMTLFIIGCFFWHLRESAITWKKKKKSTISPMPRSVTPAEKRRIQRLCSPKEDDAGVMSCGKCRPDRAVARRFSFLSVCWFHVSERTGSCPCASGTHCRGVSERPRGRGPPSRAIRRPSAASGERTRRSARRAADFLTTGLADGSPPRVRRPVSAPGL